MRNTVQLTDRQLQCPVSWQWIFIFLHFSLSQTLQCKFKNVFTKSTLKWPNLIWKFSYTNWKIHINKLQILSIKHKIEKNISTPTALCTDVGLITKGAITFFYSFLFTLLGFGSEWPKDQALLLTMVSYLKK